ncbi:methylated-DNA--[protein]-cysteine S-methyltransferase [Rhodococcus spelaei]|uniref:methylated-DNA--[protein]-cysteine S-methyltransferase n=1 Tax=Rhodococcus spelaei TaxID=2546320 RepID=A0A541BAF6_9NOCA|nr:methylated-DNA--[protein]-cysteine S-methyltransferase [Rhodococcus spelaei]TQF69315.1 methylated-DNA--[protein]-cysteine S-methyltransferase [Rhodococcus spelaei]
MTAPGYTLFDTAIGRCALAWSDRGVVGLQLPEVSAERTLARLLDAHPTMQDRAPSPAARRAVEGVTALLTGVPDDLADVPLDLSAVAEFDRRVYAVTRDIDPGEVLTYGRVAALIGSPDGAQAVGQSLGRNPIPILVPCHRVLAAGGKVGGFSASGGTVTKRALLALEHTPGFDDPTLF